MLTKECCSDKSDNLIGREKSKGVRGKRHKSKLHLNLTFSFYSIHIYLHY